MSEGRTIFEDKDHRVIEVGKDFVAEVATGHDRLGKPVWPDANYKLPADPKEREAALQGQMTALTKALRKLQDAEDERQRREEERRYERGGPGDR